MSDVPFQHPGSVPPRPEVPEGVTPGPRPRPSNVRDLAAFAWWTPFAAAGVALLVTFIGFSIIALIYQATGGRLDVDDAPPGITIGATLIQAAAMVAAAVLFAGIGGVRPTPAAFGFRPTRFWKALGLAFALMVVYLVFNYVYNLAFDINETDDLPGKLGAKDSTINFIAVAVMVCLAAPLAEEFFFRGFCFPAFATVLGWKWSAVAVGVLFGAIHIGGTKAILLPSLMVLGFLFCLLYKFTGSILPCIALHAFNNGAALSLYMEFEWWGWLIAVTGAPLACMAIVMPLARRMRPALT